jgi:hypothetical protein
MVERFRKYNLESDEGDRWILLISEAMSADDYLQNQAGRSTLNANGDREYTLYRATGTEMTVTVPSGVTSDRYLEAGRMADEYLLGQGDQRIERGENDGKLYWETHDGQRLPFIAAFLHDFNWLLSVGFDIFCEAGKMYLEDKAKGKDKGKRQENLPHHRT